MAAQSSERPLALRCGAFGDMVLLTALIRVLHAEFRLPVDIVTSGPWSLPLLKGQPGVGDIFSLRSRRTPYWMSLDQQRVVRQLRARGAGPTWYCDGDPAAMPILERAGTTSADIVNVKDHPLLPGEHATQQWRRMAQIMPPGVSAGPRADIDAIAEGCCLAVTPAQRSRPRRLAGAPRSGGSTADPDANRQQAHHAPRAAATRCQPQILAQRTLGRGLEIPARTASAARHRAFGHGPGI